MHTENDRLKKAEILAKEVIRFSNRCKFDEYQSLDERCEELAKVAALAGEVICDTGQYNNQLEDHKFKESGIESKL